MAIKLLTEKDLPEIWLIRHQAMYPDQSLDIVKLPNDHTSDHFGWTVNNELVSVITVERKGDIHQFRKFATLPALQNKGYGSQLLTQVLEWMKEQGAEKVWCNARKTAADYYKKFGMEETNETYEKYGLLFVLMEKTF